MQSSQTSAIEQLLQQPAADPSPAERRTERALNRVVGRILRKPSAGSAMEQGVRDLAARVFPRHPGQTLSEHGVAFVATRLRESMAETMQVGRAKGGP